VTVLEDLAPPPRVDVRPRGMSRREAWQRRLPLLPALIYIVVVTQIPFVVTLWYSFQNYFFDVPGGAHFTGLSNYKAVFKDAAFRGSLVRSVIMTVTAVIVAMILGVAVAVLLDRKYQAFGHVGKTSRPEDRNQHLRSVISDMRQETGADRVHESADRPANNAHDENDQQSSPRVAILWHVHECKR
jgi:hypothetical protein